MPFPSPALYPSPGLDDPYFTVAELRARYPEVTSQKYADNVVEARRSEVEERLEKLCDVAFVPRQATGETSERHRGRDLPVHHTKPITVTGSLGCHQPRSTSPTPWWLAARSTCRPGGTRACRT
jgi:hypothetical protein